MAYKRNLQEVIQLIINILPPDQLNLISDLRDDSKNAAMCLPGDETPWDNAQLTLTKYIESPSKYWEWVAWSIFSKKSISELKTIFKND